MLALDVASPRQSGRSERLAHHKDTLPLAIVWVITHSCSGDNEQSLALAESLAWPFEVKHVVANRMELVALLSVGATLAGVERGSRPQFSPPWPDLVISAGRETEAV